MASPKYIFDVNNHTVKHEAPSPGALSSSTRRPSPIHAEQPFVFGTLQTFGTQTIDNQTNSNANNEINQATGTGTGSNKENDESPQSKYWYPPIRALDSPLTVNETNNKSTTKSSNDAPPSLQPRSDAVPQRKHNNYNHASTGIDWNDMQADSNYNNNNNNTSSYGGPYGHEEMSSNDVWSQVSGMTEETGLFCSAAGTSSSDKQPPSQMSDNNRYEHLYGRDNSFGADQLRTFAPTSSYNSFSNHQSAPAWTRLLEPRPSTDNKFDRMNSTTGFARSDTSAFQPGFAPTGGNDFAPTAGSEFARPNFSASMRKSGPFHFEPIGGNTFATNGTGPHDNQATNTIYEDPSLKQDPSPAALQSPRPGNVTNDATDMFSPTRTTFSSSNMSTPRSNTTTTSNVSTPGRRGDLVVKTLQTIVTAARNGKSSFKHPIKQYWVQIDGYTTYDSEVYEASVIDYEFPVLVTKYGGGVNCPHFVRHKGRSVPAEDDPKALALKAKALAAVLVDKSIEKGITLLLCGGSVDCEAVVRAAPWKYQTSMLSKTFRCCVQSMLLSTSFQYEPAFKKLLYKYIEAFAKAAFVAVSNDASVAGVRTEYFDILSLLNDGRLSSPKKRVAHSRGESDDGSEGDDDYDDDDSDDGYDKKPAPKKSSKPVPDDEMEDSDYDSLTRREKALLAFCREDAKEARENAKEMHKTVQENNQATHKTAQSAAKATLESEKELTARFSTTMNALKKTPNRKRRDDDQEDQGRPPKRARDR